MVIALEGQCLRVYSPKLRQSFKPTEGTKTVIEFDREDDSLFVLKDDEGNVVAACEFSGMALRDIDREPCFDDRDLARQHVAEKVQSWYFTSGQTEKDGVRIITRDEGHPIVQVVVDKQFDIPTRVEILRIDGPELLPQESLS